jgi:hypothetical protein
MKRRSMDGQLNMFDFWSQLTPPEDGGEVQMVSLMPEEADDTEPGEDGDSQTDGIESMGDVYVPPEHAESVEDVDVPPERARSWNPSEAPVMHRESRNADGTIKAEISFYNYNRVCVKRQNEEAVWKNFDNSKDAVDYYMEEMLKL